MRPSLACLAASAARTVSRRAQRGIYAGKDVRSGNKVSEDGGNRSRRTWKPNVQKKSLWLSAAGRHVRLPVTTTALRAIDKSGGLDSFLLNAKPAKLDPAARALRDWLVGWNAAKAQLFKSSSGGEVAAAAAASEASEAAPAVSPP